MSAHELSDPVPPHLILPDEELDFEPHPDAADMTDAERAKSVFLTPIEAGLQHFGTRYYTVPYASDHIGVASSLPLTERVSKQSEKLRQRALDRPRDYDVLIQRVRSARQLVAAAAYVIHHPQRNDPFDIPSIAQSMDRRPLEIEFYRRRFMRFSYWAIAFAKDTSAVFAELDPVKQASMHADLVKRQSAHYRRDTHPEIPN